MYAHIYIDTYDASNKKLWKSKVKNQTYLKLWSKFDVGPSCNLTKSQPN